MLEDVVAGALRALEPEQAHRAAIMGLKAGFGPCATADWSARLKTEVAGLALPNPIGMAAGFDKNGEVPDALLRAGFGFVECGTATPFPQAGNPRPRLFRLSADRAVINRLGFNNEGQAAFAARLQARAGRPGVVGANIGANKDSPDRVGDYVRGLEIVWPLASYATINISSPNTPGLRGLQERGALEDLLGRIGEARARLVSTHGAKPVFLKAAPDLDELAVRDISELALAHDLSGLIVSNTTISRPGDLQSAHKGEAGGLSGAPLMGLSTQVLKLFAQALGGRLPLIGVGGVSSGADALAKIKAGASAVQLYTALVFEGPGLAHRIACELDALLAVEGFACVGDAVGAGLK